jgi:hypothetical protein
MKRRFKIELVVSVLVLLGAYALGLGIRQARMLRARSETRPRPLSAVEASSPVAPVADTNRDPRPSAEQPRDPSADTDAPVQETLPETEMVAPIEAVASEDKPSIPEPLSTTPRDWRSLWSNLDLTAEEQARFQEGMRLAWQRWQGLSPEDRQAEAARWTLMRERWQVMSDEERLAASQRIRDRFEAWRISGDVELPELSLD